ncbi:glycosyltransferase family 39 protein [Oleispirillum naphthae]|uniref:glycosyltransferase family 39 protein n=1 Tax=Oleispirillum naphthae TaxID=2838853 RepID=UPI0030822139
MSSLFARLRAKPGRTASLAVFAVMGILLLATFHRYGISNDEEVQQTYGELLIRYYASGFADDNAFHYRNLYLYGGLFDLIAAGIGPHLPMATYEWRHLLTAVFGMLGMWGTWRLARLLSSDGWACVAVLLLAATGAWWGTLCNHTKDVSFAGAMIWVTYYAARIAPHLPRPRPRHVIGLGAAMGCALGLRIVAVYAGLEIAILLIVAAMDTREGFRGFARGLGSSILHLLPAGAVGLAIMAVSWPWSVLAPGNILVAIDTFRRFPINLWTRLGGVAIKAADVPRWYLPTYVAIRLPELALLGLACGSACSLLDTFRRRFERLHALRLLPVLLAVAVPMGHAVFSDPVLYNGLRHYMFLLPPLAVLATLGLRAAYHCIVRRLGLRMGRAFLAVCAALWMVHAGTLVRLHPYESVAYNSLAGGVSGAAGRYEFDYWGNSIREATNRLTRMVAAEEASGKQDRRFGPPYRVAVCAEQIQADEYLPAKFRMTTNWLTADFFISQIQDGCENDMDGKVVIDIKRLGTTIGVVKDRRAITRAERGEN